MSSWFENVEGAAPIEIFLLNKLYKEDTFEQKIDLGIGKCLEFLFELFPISFWFPIFTNDKCISLLGAYRTDDAKPWVLPAVRKAEKLIANDESLNHEYLPILGMEDFSELATRILLGEDSVALKEKRVLSAQSLSGTGALRVLADFLKRCCQADTVYISGNFSIWISKSNWNNRNLFCSFKN